MPGSAKAPFTVVIVVFPHFSHAGTSAFIEPFRVVNERRRQELFRWRLVSEVGGWVTASDGSSVSTTALVELSELPDAVMLSFSGQADGLKSPALGNQLRAWACQGVTLGAMDSATSLLASEGLLDGRRAAANFEQLSALTERFPAVRFCREMLVIDGKRITCCGSIAATDCALHIIGSLYGQALMKQTASYLFHEPPGELDRGSLNGRAGRRASNLPEAVELAIRLMEDNLEDAIAIPEICTRVGISQRQLNRLFSHTLSTSPAVYYRDIRLDHARALVRQTDRPLLDVAVASGFSNQSHFSRLYRQRFKVSPTIDRRQLRQR